MIYVLIVDDSNTVCSTLESMIKKRLGYQPIIAHSQKECAQKLLQYRGKIAVALLDLGLPDAPNGEVVDFVTKFDIPSIVLTGSTDKEDTFRNKKIVDYVIKDGSFAFEYTVGLVKRIVTNKYLRVLVAEDSKVAAKHTIDLLKRYQLMCYHATDGKEALEMIESVDGIKIIFTDYNMPNVDGLELLKAVRKKHTKDELCVVIVTSESDDNGKAVANFLKHGANDFLYKGFSDEEFYARLNSNLEVMELFEDIKNKANKDFMTGAYNRRYFFQEGNMRFNSEDNTKLFMVDIDKFKQINDQFGHDIGDIAIKEVINILNRELINEDVIVSRFGGEEFCGLVFDRTDEEFLNLLEKIRLSFENNIINTPKGELKYTVSIGYALDKHESLDETINYADKGLYRAKNSGRNQIRTHTGES
jgi:diguanylate cyclase (GGDEF)-like protein